MLMLDGLADGSAKRSERWSPDRCKWCARLRQVMAHTGLHCQPVGNIYKLATQHLARTGHSRVRAFLYQNRPSAAFLTPPL